MADEKKPKTKQEYTNAIGRRKESVAVVRLYKGKTLWDGVALDKGDILVNKKKAEEYFGKNAIKIYTKPFSITGTENKFAVTIRVKGGGNRGQLDAATLGVARALDKFDRERFHTLLAGKDLLTRDARVRERRKVGMGGKARRKKQSPKR